MQQILATESIFCANACYTIKEIHRNPQSEEEVISWLPKIIHCIPFYICHLFQDVCGVSSINSKESSVTGSKMMRQVDSTYWWATKSNINPCLEIATKNLASKNDRLWSCIYGTKAKILFRSLEFEKLLDYFYAETCQKIDIWCT